nr:hypothetical protein CFP56_14028 [Quercus suber]
MGRVLPGPIRNRVGLTLPSLNSVRHSDTPSFCSVLISLEDPSEFTLFKVLQLCGGRTLQSILDSLMKRMGVVSQLWTIRYFVLI